MDKELQSGMLIVFATLCAIVVSNSALAHVYEHFLHAEISMLFNDYGYHSSLLHFVNEGLMAIFFFHVGLEIKHSFVFGDLRGTKQRLLPAIAALGGMVIPAIIYLQVTSDYQNASDGWAIPVATDIAFSLAFFMLFVKRLPPFLKIFLISLATFDDMGAIVIIAAYYTGNLSYTLLFMTGIICFIMVMMAVFKKESIGIYILLGFIMWCLVTESGVHATIAGILSAVLIPYTEGTRSRLEAVEKGLYTWVYFFILPLFAFLNAGVPMLKYSLTFVLSSPIFSAIAMGLVIGKPLGIYLFVALAKYFGFVELPEDVTSRHLIGVGFLCGIGFTMSLFIASLAFDGFGDLYDIASRMGILVGSFLSAVLGSFVLYMCSRRTVVVNA